LVFLVAGALFIYFLFEKEMKMKMMVGDLGFRR
jgi:hypothetical protein